MDRIWVRFGCCKPYLAFLNLPLHCYAYRKMNDLAWFMRTHNPKVGGSSPPPPEPKSRRWNKTKKARRHQRRGKLNSLISGLEFPDKSLIIPCSIQRKNLTLAAEVAKNEAFRATSGRNGPAKFTKFPVFFPVSREFRPEKGSLVTASSASKSQRQRNSAAFL
jgi:hypothetical protein